MGKHKVGDRVKILPAAASVNVHFKDFNKIGTITVLAKVCGNPVAHVAVTQGIKGSYIIPTRYLENAPEVEIDMKEYHKLKEENS